MLAKDLICQILKKPSLKKSQVFVSGRKNPSVKNNAQKIDTFWRFHGKGTLSQQQVNKEVYSFQNSIKKKTLSIFLKKKLYTYFDTAFNKDKLLNVNKE